MVTVRLQKKFGKPISIVPEDEARNEKARDDNRFLDELDQLAREPGRVNPIEKVHPES